MKNILSFLLGVFIFSIAFGQKGEFLAPLQTNPSLNQKEAALMKSGKRADDVSKVVFTFKTRLIDETSIFDDFSTNKVRSYEYSLSDPGVTFETNYNFKVDGGYVATLEAMRGVSYNYTFNSVTNQWDSTANPAMQVVFFSPTEWQVPVDTDTLWIRPPAALINGTLYPDSIKADTILVNKADTTYYVPNQGDEEIWINHSVYINNHYAVSPPTIGVATFDGLDSIGKPYDQSGPNTFGRADILESFPIDLSKLANTSDLDATDSVALFFQVQPQGLGDIPEAKDSLVLQFYAPEAKEWRNIWSMEGTGLKPFSKHFIRILSPDYFKNGFKFRFVNYATLSGNFDHWHLDYVWLKHDFEVGDTNFVDVAMVNQATSYLEDYSQMPWSHFKTDPASFMKKNKKFEVRNLDAAAHLNKYNITGVDAQGTPVATIPERINSNFKGSSIVEEEMSLNSFVFTIPTVDTSERFFYDMKKTVESSPDNVRSNDVAQYRQSFGTYYSYSDGTMEAAYYLQGPGAQVAIEYNAALKDSLRAINIFIPQTRNNITNNLYRIKVWKSISPEDVLFSSVYLDPAYAPSRNRGIRFELPSPIEVEGQFFIGIEQQVDPVYLGFDRNLPNNGKTYFNLGGVWTPSVQEGRLMIQPDFGGEYIIDPSSVVPVSQEKLEVKAYPNPVQDMLYLEWANQLERLDYTIFNLQGQEVKTGTVNKEEPIDFYQLRKGFYIINLQGRNAGQIARVKVLKTE